MNTFLNQLNANTTLNDEYVTTLIHWCQLMDVHQLMRCYQLSSNWYRFLHQSPNAWTTATVNQPYQFKFKSILSITQNLDADKLGDGHGDGGRHIPVPHSTTGSAGSTLKDLTKSLPFIRELQITEQKGLIKDTDASVSSITTTGTQSNPSPILPRPILSDPGYPDSYRRWLDLQGQDQPNDYARFVGPHNARFLSVALAGRVPQEEITQEHTQPGVFVLTNQGEVVKGPRWNSFASLLGLKPEPHTHTSMAVTPQMPNFHSVKASWYNPASFSLETSSAYVFFGVTCSGCGANPIVAQRWKCTTCANYNYCKFCKLAGPPHTANHTMIQIDLEGKTVMRESQSSSCAVTPTSSTQPAPSHPRPILPRQPITDTGYPHTFHGWFDLQGQGVPNDYVRFVGKSNSRWLSVALAGRGPMKELTHEFTQPDVYVLNADGRVVRGPKWHTLGRTIDVTPLPYAITRSDLHHLLYLRHLNRLILSSANCFTDLMRLFQQLLYLSSLRELELGDPDFLPSECIITLIGYLQLTHLSLNLDQTKSYLIEPLSATKLAEKYLLQLSIHVSGPLPPNYTDTHRLWERFRRLRKVEIWAEVSLIWIDTLNNTTIRIEHDDKSNPPKVFSHLASLSFTGPPNLNILSIHSITGGSSLSADQLKSIFVYPMNGRPKSSASTVKYLTLSFAQYPANLLTILAQVAPHLLGLKLMIQPQFDPHTLLQGRLDELNGSNLQYLIFAFDPSVHGSLPHEQWLEVFQRIFQHLPALFYAQLGQMERYRSGSLPDHTKPPPSKFRYQSIPIKLTESPDHAWSHMPVKSAYSPNFEMRLLSDDDLQLLQTAGGRPSPYDRLNQFNNINQSTCTSFRYLIGDLIALAATYLPFLDLLVIRQLSRHWSHFGRLPRAWSLSYFNSDYSRWLVFGSMSQFIQQLIITAPYLRTLTLPACSSWPVQQDIDFHPFSVMTYLEHLIFIGPCTPEFLICPPQLKAIEFKPDIYDVSRHSCNWSPDLFVALGRMAIKQLLFHSDGNSTSGRPGSRAFWQQLSSSSLAREHLESLKVPIHLYSLFGHKEEGMMKRFLQLHQLELKVQHVSPNEFATQFLLSLTHLPAIRILILDTSNSTWPIGDEHLHLLLSNPSFAQRLAYLSLKPIGFSKTNLLRLMNEATSLVGLELVQTSQLSNSGESGHYWSNRLDEWNSYPDGGHRTARINRSNQQQTNVATLASLRTSTSDLQSSTAVVKQNIQQLETDHIDLIAFISAPSSFRERLLFLKLLVPEVPSTRRSQQQLLQRYPSILKLQFNNVITTRPMATASNSSTTTTDSSNATDSRHIPSDHTHLIPLMITRFNMQLNNYESGDTFDYDHSHTENDEPHEYDASDND